MKSCSYNPRTSGNSRSQDGCGQIPVLQKPVPQETKHHTQRAGELRFTALAGPEELTLPALSPDKEVTEFLKTVHGSRLQWAALTVHRLIQTWGLLNLGTAVRTQRGRCLTFTQTNMIKQDCRVWVIDKGE